MGLLESVRNRVEHSSGIGQKWATAPGGPGLDRGFSILTIQHFSQRQNGSETAPSPERVFEVTGKDPRL